MVERIGCEHGIPRTQTGRKPAIPSLVVTRRTRDSGNLRPRATLSLLYRLPNSVVLDHRVPQVTVLTAVGTDSRSPAECAAEIRNLDAFSCPGLCKRL